jgi:amino acid adenylation domain-containing protein
LNGQPVDRKVFSSLPDLLSHYGKTAPRRVAILAPGHAAVTYGALRLRALEAAGHLRGLGLDRDARVAVVLPNGPEMAMAVVAIATAAVCVPLNPAFTADECQRYFCDLRIAALLTGGNAESACRSVAHQRGIPILDLPLAPGGALKPKPVRPPLLDHQELTRASDDAFVLLTSGTTSRPKMVPLTHASICLSARNAGAVLELGPRDRLLNVLPLFHAHGLISGLLAGLAAGSSVVCTPGFESASFFRWLTEFRPSWYTAVPAIHRAILSAADRAKPKHQRCSLRLIRSASASLPLHVLDGLESLFGVPVIETYGMTEAASQIAANPLRHRKQGSVGQAAGAEIAIMDKDARQRAAGERGEIALRGPTLTGGYDNDLAATRSAFRRGWFRTGDLGYLDAEGYLFIVGRLKEVINRGGQQIAPPEVEAALLSHKEVVEAVAFSVPHARLGEDVGAAVVLRSNSATTAQDLRAFIGERLARFKVPGLIRILAEIPKTPGGKINRAAVSASLFAEGNSRRAQAPERPRSELEVKLAKLWAELLELDEIGVEEDVFALGADSLVVTQMRSRLRDRCAADVSFREIFDAPTVAALAKHVEMLRTRPPAKAFDLRREPANARGTRLSYQQQRIYVLSRLDPTKHNYDVVEIARLRGHLELEALGASLAAICERHETLRFVFHERSGEPFQKPGKAWPRLEPPRLEPCAEGSRAAAIRRHAQGLLQEPLDLEKGPPFRARLLQLGKDDHALMIKLHHLVTDGWAQRLFWKELETFYGAKLKGVPAELLPLKVQYRDFVKWQRAWLRTQEAERQLTYWRVQLEGLTELPLRTDKPRPPIWTGRGARHVFSLSPTLSKGIKALSRAQGVTVFMTLVAAFQCVLHRHTKHDDVAIGSLIANRNQVEREPLIGLFANTVVLRSDLSGDPKFSDFLTLVRQLTLDAYRNQDLPIEEVLKGLKLPRGLDRNALFRVMFILQSAAKDPSLPGLYVKLLDPRPGIARFDLTLELMQATEGFGGWFEYNTDLFEAATIARMATHLRNFLAAIILDPDKRISRIPLLSAHERDTLLVDWNATETARRCRVFSLSFARQAACAPEAMAVSTTNARLDYCELALRSSNIARRLLREGSGPHIVVVLLAKRDMHLLAGMVAVQQAGGAFLALDPTWPAARIGQIIAASRAPIVLTGPGCPASLKSALSAIAERPKILDIKTLASSASGKPSPGIRPAPSHLGYVIYTSGTTGVPKGAMIEQRGLANHLDFLIAELSLSTSDVVAQTAPQSFDISIWQFLAPLMVGARVHICADAVIRDPAMLLAEIDRERVTILQIVPALLRGMLEQTRGTPGFRALGGLRLLISTGEPLSVELCRQWFQHFPQVPLINAYGPAECSDDVAIHRMATPPASLTTAPIGHPIPNTQLYVLDAHLQPEPIGVTGELYVGGVGVGRGYLNDPEQTRQNFLRDPFSNRRGRRLYRTGDLARWHADGTLEYLGRVDHQVKLRGHRIELEEIEHLLAEHPKVDEAVVLLREDLGVEARLAAHIVPAGTRPKTNELRDFLKTKLPAYAVPSAFFFLERMPTTAHGKLDRSALLTVRAGLEVAHTEFVAPRNRIEKALARIWVDLLKLSEVGIFDNFFELGGHSLLAGQVLARVAHAFGASLPIRAIFEAPTIEALAKRVSEASKTHLKKSSAGGILRKGGSRPISNTQEHMLRIEGELAGLPQFNLPFVYRLRGPLDVDALEQSLVEVMRRHEILRSSFAWKGGRPAALVVPAAKIKLSLTVENVASVKTPFNDRSKALLLKKAQLQAAHEALRPFDLARAPLLRARLMRLGAKDHVLVLIFHHIIVDGTSIGLYFEEVSKLYDAFQTRRQADLAKPALQFCDVARWQRSWCKTGAADRQFAYWKERLRDASAVFPMNGDARKDFVRSPITFDPVYLHDELVARLRDLGRGQGGTLFMTLLTGLKAMLLGRSGRSDICVATAMANRTRQNAERVIGPLENTTLIRTRLDLDLSFGEAFGRVRDALLDAYARQELPFDVLAARLEREGQVDPASLLQVFFALQNPLRQPLALHGVAVRSFGNIHREGQPALPIDCSWLTFMLKETASGITGSCRYKHELFGPQALPNWVTNYQALLTKAAANPKLSLGRLIDG